MAEVLRCGLIGLGRHMLRSLLPNVLADPGWSVVAAADNDGEARRRFSSRFAGIRTFPSGTELLAAADLNLAAVFIAVDPGAQAALAQQAVAAELNVFVEKPCGVNAEQLRPLVGAAERAGVVVMVGTMWRYTKAALLLRNFVSTPSRSPETLSIHASFPKLLRREKWDIDLVELAFLDMFIHPIDLACWFLRLPLEVRVVSARPFTDGKGSVIVLIQSQDTGQTANLHLVCGSHSYGVDIRASCADGSLALIRDLSELVVVTSPTWTNTEGGLRDRPYMGWDHGPLYRGYARHGYAEEIEAFRLAITDGQSLSSTPGDALLTMRTIDAAIASLHSGTPVIVDAEADCTVPHGPTSYSADGPLVARVLQCIGEAIGVTPDELGDDPQFGWPPMWDSVAHMNLMVALEVTFQVEIPDSIVPKLTSCHAITEFLAAMLHRSSRTD